MYGDTSAPQLLQTRYRSGPLDMRDVKDTPPEASARRLSKLRRRSGHDVLQELGEVVVGLEHLALPVRPVPALEQVGHALELVRRSEVGRVLAQAVVEALRERLGAHPLAAREIDQL